MCEILDKIDFGKDLERQLDIYTEARPLNIDSISIKLVIGSLTADREGAGPRYEGAGAGEGAGVQVAAQQVPDHPLRQVHEEGLTTLRRRQ